MENYFEDIKCYYDEAIDAIVKLREAAESLRDKMEEMIDACETLENSI